MNGSNLKYKLALEVALEMERQGLHRSDLAERLGCTRENVDQFFTREGGMQLSTVERIAAALGCKATVHLEPQAVAAIPTYAMAAVEEEFLPPLPQLTLKDLGTSSRRVKQLLYDFIVQSYFRTGPPENERDPRHWESTPEQCGLKVFFKHGRWHARWNWPDGGEEFVRFELDRRGRLMQHDAEAKGSGALDA